MISAALSMACLRYCHTFSYRISASTVANPSSRHFNGGYNKEYGALLPPCDMECKSGIKVYFNNDILINLNVYFYRLMSNVAKTIEQSELRFKCDFFYISLACVFCQ